MQRDRGFHRSVVDQLGRLIVGGQFGREGSLPREDELTTRLGVSRTVIREATKTLQALGLVVTKPRLGTRVQPIENWRLLDPQVVEWLSDAEMPAGFERDLLELREIIEPPAAEFAALRGSDAELAAIASALRAMEAAGTKVDHEVADFRFHEAILDASGNLLLAQMKPVLHAVLKASFRLSMHDHQRARASVAVHGRVTDAILARDPDSARNAVLALLQTARDDIAEKARPYVTAATLPPIDEFDRPKKRTSKDETKRGTSDDSISRKVRISSA